MRRETEKERHERAARDFEKHVASAGPGYSWRFKRPNSSTYYFRVTWAPGVLVCSGDIGELVVRHYSFDDPWSAAAWVNGANFDYFMEKTPERKIFDPEATAEHLIADAYRRMRDMGLRDGVGVVMEGIVDFNCTIDDAYDRDVRKEACRHLKICAECREFDERNAYDICHDGEMILYDYPSSEYGHRYIAFKKWAAWMWENEPLWHKALRQWWKFQALRKSYRDYPIIWAPILYQKFENGKLVAYNGVTYWRWHRWHDAKCDARFSYRALKPWKPFGHDMTRFGFWRDQGSSTGDNGGFDGWGRPLKPGDGFRDVRAA